jgi:hypothetical protein
MVGGEAQDLSSSASFDIEDALDVEMSRPEASWFEGDINNNNEGSSRQAKVPHRSPCQILCFSDLVTRDLVCKSLVVSDVQLIQTRSLELKVRQSWRSSTVCLKSPNYVRSLACPDFT